VAVCRQLNAVRYSGRDILQEVRRAARVTQSDEPREDELCLRLDCDERPHVTERAALRILALHVLLLRADEQPDFVNLHALRDDVVDRLVLIPRVGFADAGEHAQDRALCDASQTRR
jgi:hypothetical protein